MSSLSQSPFSKRISDVEPSVTLAIFEVAQSLRKEGHHVYDFGVGEMQPDIEIPSTLIQNVKDAMDEGFNRYCSAQGMLELRQTLAEDMEHCFGFPGYTSDDVTIFPGAKPAIYAALLTLLRPEFGDRVVAFKPSYEAFDNLSFVVSGMMPILVPTKHDFTPDLHALDEVLCANQNAKVLILNSPNNPTGVVYSDSLLEELAQVLKRHPHVWVVSDEVYRTLCYEATSDKATPFHHVSIAKYLPERTVVVSAASKEVAGTGLRLGYTFVKNQAELVRLMSSFIGNAMSSVTQAVQVGYSRFLLHDRDGAARMSIRYKLDCKRTAAIQAIQRHAPLVTFPGTPLGGFYLFPCLTGYIGRTTKDGKRIADDIELCKYLIQEARVAVIPGTSFKMPGYCRIAYASMEKEQVESGCIAFGNALSTLLQVQELIPASKQA